MTLPRITSETAAIIRHIHLDGDISAVELGRTLGIKEHVVRYAIRQLEESGVITRKPFINVYPLGLMHYAIFFSLSTASTKRYEDVVRYLTNSDKVSFVVELG